MIISRIDGKTHRKIKPGIGSTGIFLQYNSNSLVYKYSKGYVRLVNTYIGVFFSDENHREFGHILRVYSNMFVRSRFTNSNLLKEVRVLLK